MGLPALRKKKYYIKGVLSTQEEEVEEGGRKGGTEAEEVSNQSPMLPFWGQNLAKCINLKLSTH